MGAIAEIGLSLVATVIEEGVRWAWAKFDDFDPGEQAQPEIGETRFSFLGAPPEVVGDKGTLRVEIPVWFGQVLTGLDGKGGAKVTIWIDEEAAAVPTLYSGKLGQTEAVLVVDLPLAPTTHGTFKIRAQVTVEGEEAHLLWDSKANLTKWNSTPFILTIDRPYSVKDALNGSTLHGESGVAVSVDVHSVSPVKGEPYVRWCWWDSSVPLDSLQIELEGARTNARLEEILNSDRFENPAERSRAGFVFKGFSQRYPSPTDTCMKGGSDVRVLNGVVFHDPAEVHGVARARLVALVAFKISASMLNADQDYLDVRLVHGAIDCVDPSPFGAAKPQEAQESGEEQQEEEPPQEGEPPPQETSEPAPEGEGLGDAAEVADEDAEATASDGPPSDEALATEASAAAAGEWPTGGISGLTADERAALTASGVESLDAFVTSRDPAAITLLGEERAKRIIAAARLQRAITGLIWDDAFLLATLNITSLDEARMAAQRVVGSPTVILPRVGYPADYDLSGLRRLASG